MWRILLILYGLMRASLPMQSFASDFLTISDIDVRPVQETSTDAFSILQILMEAREAFEKRDYEKAAGHYDVLVKYDPLMEESITGLAKSQLALNRSDLAQDLLLKTSISTVEIDVLTAIATAMNLPLLDSKEYLNDAVIKYPDARLWNLLGDNSIKRQAWQDASRAFYAAEKAGQRPGLLLNNLGLLALHTGEYDLALRHLENAVLTSPQTIKFDDNRRLALLFNGKYARALEGLTQDKSIFVLADATIIASMSGDKTLAELLRLKAIEINPRHIPTIQ